MKKDQNAHYLQCDLDIRRRQKRCEVALGSLSVFHRVFHLLVKCVGKNKSFERIILYAVWYGRISRVGDS